ncbi:hypothetical protein BH20ACT2_BH20ACT2_11960 [soil metagenome]
MPWRHDGRIALLAPVPDGPPPGPATVRHALALARRQGYAEAVTAALSAMEQRGFAAAGFGVRERLNLLSHDLRALTDPDPAERVRLRRSGRTDRPAVLQLDAEAFDGFWQLDGGGLDDAVTATPNTRFRVAVHRDRPEQVVGYAVTGRSLRRGYVQRLAVHPSWRRCGVGAALVLDGLRWLRRHRATVALVNTQEANLAALALYERLGFDRRPEGLTVMGRPLDDLTVGP